MMVYGSVCSGIEAATVAWHPLGWKPAFFSEIEAFPRAVLTHHYPETPLHGDFTTIKAGEYAAIDVLVGGTPCQSFSVAGLRGGLADERGNLALEYLRLAQRLRPSWLVWENVPGVLSSAGGRDFGSILGGLGELGYGFAYRVLDAQYFGVPQRRRRVFLVGYLGDWRRAAAVLFERHSLQGHPAPSRQAREDVAPTLSARTKGGGGLGTDFDCDGGLVANSLRAQPNDPHDATKTTYVAHTLTAKGGARLDYETETFITQRGGVFEDAIPFDTTQITSRKNRSQPKPGDPCHPVTSGGHPPALAFNARQDPDSGPVTHPLDTHGHSIGVQSGWQVRRLTPTECERLQGFPDHYTAVPYRGKQAADGPRYKALGNSMAVPVMAWIGQRIASVEAIA